MSARYARHGMRRLLVGLFLLGLVAAGANLAGCRERSAAREPAAQDSAQAVPVQILHPRIREVQRTLRVDATVEAGRRTNVSPEVSGLVATIFKREGDPVAAGEPLLAVADEDFRLALAQAKAQLAQAKAAVAQAEARLQNARSEHARATKLRARGILSPDAFEKSEAGLRVAAAALQAARAQQQAAAANVARAEKSLRDTVVHAPFSGHVAQRLVDEGTVIRTMPPTTAMVVVETDPIKVEGAIGEYDVPAVTVGQPVQVVLDAFPGRSWQGKVEMVQPTLDPVTRSAKIRVMLPNPAGELKPGMAATLVVDLGTVRGLAIPRDVFTTLGGATGRVYVVGADQRVAARDVPIRHRAGEWVIVGGGLAENDAVIATGQASVHPGDHVTVTGGVS
ncbi:MAG: efflux RND transporter periplasmic adaptor subunit [Candidatus Binatia bacterium]